MQFQRLQDRRRGAVVEGVMQAAFAGDETDLLVGAGRADDAGPGNAGKLPGDLTHSTRCGGDIDAVAFLRLADQHHADIGGQSGKAERAEIVRQRRKLRVHPAQALAALRHGPVSPVQHAEDVVAFAEIPVPAALDNADDAAEQRLAHLETRGIGDAAGVHQATHVGIDGHVEMPDQHVARIEQRHLGLRHPEILLAHPALRMTVQYDLSRQRHDFPPSCRPNTASAGAEGEAADQFAGSG